MKSCVPKYQGRTLTKIEEKSGGKNRGSVNGFYQDGSTRQYFIKKPDKIAELFTELFAGLLLDELKRRGLIDKKYHSLLICADWIQFDDKSYGLIQPRVLFNELFREIGTAYRDGSDRDPRLEMVWGPYYYRAIADMQPYLGLALILMLSLLLGDYSVHSGNVVCFKYLSLQECFVTLLARIDLGAAFRNYACPDNNKDLLYPMEYQGMANYRWYTKGYIWNYLGIPGILPAIAAESASLKKRVSDEELADILTCVLNRIPADLLDKRAKYELAGYMGMGSFASVDFGHVPSYQWFIKDMITTLNIRLTKMTEFKDRADEHVSTTKSTPYRDYNAGVVHIEINDELTFPQQIVHWRNHIAEVDELALFDFNTVLLPSLVAQFNRYLDNLLFQGGESVGGSRVSTDCEGRENHRDVLKRKYVLKEDATPLFSCDESILPYLNGKNDAYWQQVENSLSLGFNLIILIRMLCDAQQELFNKKPTVSQIPDLLISFKTGLETWYNANRKLDELCVMEPSQTDIGEQNQKSVAELILFFNRKSNDRKPANCQEINKSFAHTGH
ncbi:hypothetical protein Lspi_0602 [Legionella spiritensis]|uniref:Uncharacterized protein n=1 Tax=Legionella spiritensis TaxID=452 RepID=A0A0W0Z8U0_LEGSP|nr:hypothetical protein Lspi_0602 [Legionella spiritensis]SNV44666.1 substrate of the Dot/Icm secretion system, LepB-like [Legionella spiritensis]